MASKQTLVFSTGKSNKAHVHDSACGALNRCGRKEIRITEGVAEEIADLRERGFRVVFCKCTREA